MPSLIHKPRRKVVLFAAGALALLLLGAVAGGFVLLSGAYSTAATTQHFAITHRLLDAGLRFSVRASAADVEVPPLNSAAMIEQGAVCYRTHCAQCHGAPGVARDPEGRGMLPIASNLAQSAREWPPAWLYYVTKKGVRMSGMPAWEFRMSENSLWATVAFLTRLPFMHHSEYRAIDEQTRGAACEPASEVPLPYSQEYAKITFRQYACHSCHRIDGVIGPKSYVGPPLASWSQRKYVAGVLPNNEINLVRFIRDPQSVSEHSLMPNLEVSEAHAHVMARYLFAQD
jgi:mono/diheme cytochrome c family protein/cytochrome c551/c552